MRRNSLRAVAVPLVWLVCSFCALSASPDYSSGLLDRDAALAAAREVISEQYSNANEVLVDGMQWMTYEADGTYEQWHEEYIKILTEEGRRAHSTISSYFTLPYQRGREDCRVARAEIVKSDGAVTEIDVDAQSRVMINPSGMDVNIYNPNSKLIRVNVPGLEVGDVLHFVMYDRIVKPRMANTWSDWLVLEGTRPIRRSVVEIHAPRDSPLRRIALKDEIEGTVAHTKGKKDDRLWYRWEVRNVPRMFPEPNMPLFHTVVQRLLVSTIPDWETVSRWYWQISEPHYEPTDAMRAKTEELVRGQEDPRQKIESLFGYVSQEIRYMGITVEATAPGYEPHDVKDTFEARHGVCRDKAALLVVMLRLAGVEAFPTLVHNGPKRDVEVPQPYFNHAIVAARAGIEDYVLMDPTDETTADLFPAYLNDKSFLIAMPEGEGLLVSPIDPVENNLMLISTTGAIDADGNLKATTVLQFDGINDNAYRGYFARAKPEDRRRFVEGLIRRTVPGAHVSRVEIAPDDMLDTSRSLEILAHYEAEQIMIAGAGRAMLPVPVMGTRVGMVNFIIGKTGLKKRKYPLLTEIACGVRERITLDVDPSLGEVISVPEQPGIQNEAFEWRMTVTKEGSELRVAGDFQLKIVEFSPSQYLELKEGLEAIELALRKMPILVSQQAPVRPDAIVLSAEVTYELADASNWTEIRDIRKKILTYAGKKRDAEVKIHYNPIWEDVRVDNVLVTGRDGDSRVISPAEINIMDAPWAGSAPRYPAGKTLVASLPGVDVGSTIAYRIVRSVAARPFFAARESFRSLDTIKHKTVRLSAPAELALQIGQGTFRGAISSEILETGGVRRAVFEWSATDVQPVMREDDLPPLWQFTPTVFISAGSWETYASQLRKTLAKAVRGQRASERKARELAGTGGDPLIRIARIRDFVAIHVRSAGPPLPELPSSSISPADTTLRDGYGNTTDTAVLLYVMLRQTGLKPEFVLVSSLPDIKTFRRTLAMCPDSGLFPRVLVRVSARSLRLSPGEHIYLNDTDQYAILGASPHEGNTCLVVADGTLARLVPARKSMLDTDYHMAVSADGEAGITKTLRFYGERFGVQNRRYTEMTPEERDRHFQQLVADISQSAEAAGELVSDFTAYPGMVRFTVTVPDYAVRTGDHLHFHFPESFQRLFSLRSDSRVNPMYLPALRHKRMSVRADLPPGFEMIISPRTWGCVDVAGADIGIAVETASLPREAPTGFVFRANAEIRPVVISPSHYDALLDVDRRLSHKRARTVLLRKK